MICLFKIASLLRTVSGIDESCSSANDKLRRLAVKLPDVASITPLDYDTSKRADPDVLQKLVQHAKILRVCECVWCQLNWMELNHHFLVII